MFFLKLKKGVFAAAALLIFAAPVYAAAAEMPEKLVPMGSVVGINLHTKGVIVAGVGEVETENGVATPAKDAGLLPGDVITMVGDREITNAGQLSEAFSTGEKVSIRVIRGDGERQLTVEPCRTADGAAIGVWVRDELKGIGTMTFYDPESGVFGALGHSVNDADSGMTVPLRDGEIFPAAVEGITAGKSGTPGQLGGVFEVKDACGIILQNNECGIFGVLEGKTPGEAVEIADKNEVVTGPATIYSTTDGDTVREYDVEITRLYSRDDNRSMMIKVTDPELLAATGGIVQGMSGSPIMQNGKLVGAVTHVLISDPTRGYGISIDRMLDAAGITEKSAA